MRFSRPAARVLFSQTMVISSFNRWPALMLRVANLRHHAMVEAEFRLMLIRNESIPEEEEDVRRFYALKLDFDRLIMFPAALTIRHNHRRAKSSLWRDADRARALRRAVHGFGGVRRYSHPRARAKSV